MKDKIRYILVFLLGVFVSGITVYASTFINSKDVSFDKSSTSMKSNNVQDAVDEVYDRAVNYCSTRYDEGYSAGLKSICEYEVGKTWDFDYTGDSQKFSVPCGGTYKVELWGAQGGSNGTDLGGLGGYTSGDLNLKENKVLYLYVGSKGNDGSKTSNFTPSSVFNGGGAGANTSYSLPVDSSPYVAGAGGGATDIRTVSGTWSTSGTLKSRIMIAAGGGGKGYYPSTPGPGGGLTGIASSNSSGSEGGTLGSSGGTQTSGGLTGRGTTTGNTNYLMANDGFFGQGGYGIYNVHPGAGGGGGYYGGGAGAGGGAGIGGSSGAGGSSFISGHDGCNAINESGSHTSQSVHYSGYKFTDTVMIDGAGYNWTTTKGSYVGQVQPNGTTAAGHSGNGYARITLVSLK